MTEALIRDENRDARQAARMTEGKAGNASSFFLQDPHA